ncbi:MAG: hypothetical protein AAGK78_12180, partial [Planctomycetota bacterium]
LDELPDFDQQAAGELANHDDTVDPLQGSATGANVLDFDEPADSGDSVAGTDLAVEALEAMADTGPSLADSLSDAVRAREASTQPEAELDDAQHIGTATAEAPPGGVDELDDDVGGFLRTVREGVSGGDDDALFLDDEPGDIRDEPAEPDPLDRPVDPSVDQRPRHMPAPAVRPRGRVAPRRPGRPLRAPTRGQRPPKPELAPGISGADLARSLSDPDPRGSARRTKWIGRVVLIVIFGFLAMALACGAIYQFLAPLTPVVVTVRHYVPQEHDLDAMRDYQVKQHNRLSSSLVDLRKRALTELETLAPSVDPDWLSDPGAYLRFAEDSNRVRFSAEGNRSDLLLGHSAKSGRDEVMRLRAVAEALRVLARQEEQYAESQRQAREKAEQDLQRRQAEAKRLGEEILELMAQMGAPVAAVGFNEQGQPVDAE